MSPAQIAAMPRYHHQYLPDRIVTEPGAVSPAATTALQAMGYEFSPSATNWSFFLHAVDWDRQTGALRGGADPRNPPGAARVVEKTEARK